jgi:hypothetical protein
MILGRAERYTIEQRHDGVVLMMRQGRNGLGVALVAGGVLLLSWWFGPYGSGTVPAFGGAAGKPDGFYWIWSSFFAFVFLASLLGIFYSGDVTITGKEIIAETSFCWWRWSRRIPRGHALGIWTETIESDGEGVAFPYRVHLLDAEGRVSGLYVELQRRRSVEQVLGALRAALTLDVRDRRP